MPSDRPSPERLAALADVVVELGHKLAVRGPELRDVVPLTGTEIAVIREIHRAPGSSPSEIATATGLRRSNVSTAVRTLEAGGLVVREQAPGNARSVTLAPTARATEHVERINAYWTARLTEAEAADLDEAVGALEALTRIAAALESR